MYSQKSSLYSARLSLPSPPNFSCCHRTFSPVFCMSYWWASFFSPMGSSDLLALTMDILQKCERSAVGLCKFADKILTGFFSYVCSYTKGRLCQRPASYIACGTNQTHWLFLKGLWAKNDFYIFKQLGKIKRLIFRDVKIIRYSNLIIHLIKFLNYVTASHLLTYFVWLLLYHNSRVEWLWLYGCKT